MLGAGGAARAAACALRSAPARPTWRSGTGRRSGRAALAAELGGARSSGRGGRHRRQLHVASGCTTRQDPFKALPLQADELGAGSCVVDMVYRAGGTRLLAAARTRGARVVDGLEILVAQGAASFERWTGRAAPREVMREAVRTIAST